LPRKAIIDRSVVKVPLFCTILPIMNIDTRIIKAVLLVRLASIEAGDWRPSDPCCFEWDLTPKPAAIVRSLLTAFVVGVYV
jgi:hypothetical protein